MKIQMLAAGAAMTMAFAGQAETVALWPIECDPATKAFNGASAIGGGDALSIYSDDPTVSGVAGTDWMLPPNPDSMVEAQNRTAVLGLLGGTVAAHGMTLRCTSAAVVDQLRPKQDFTLEGWVAMPEYKTDNWIVFMQESEGSTSGKDGWQINFSITSGSVHFILYVPTVAENKAFENFTAEEERNFTNGWHHIAFTLDYENENGKSAWTCYLDGVSKGTIVCNKVSATVTKGACQLFLGGRSSAANNRFYGAFDYWRLSDVVLTPDKFLCHGGSGTPWPVHTMSTVAYWKLDKRADGTLDASDSVGSADLSDGLYDVTAKANFFSGIVPSTEQAFVGNPPNTTAALSSPNSGSMRSPQKTGNSDSSLNGAVLVVPNLGKELSLQQSFTVEGWIKPCWKTGAAGSGFFLGNRLSTDRGWNTRISAAGEVYVYASDKSGDVRSEVKLGTFPSGWLEKWTHVALVYDADSGNGTWTLYADGVSLGSVSNAKKPTDGDCGTYFRLGGRENSDACFAANYDCWRVSQSALEPAQLLCAANGTQASGVIAYWPLDVKKGCAWDLHDEQNNYTVRAVRAESYHPVVEEDAPTVTNPDSTAAFDGCPASNEGSFNFRASDGSRSHATLATSDPRVIAAINDKNGFTIEGYLKRTAACTGMEYVFTTKTGAFSATDWSDHQIALYCGEAGFYICDKKFSNFGSSETGSFGKGVPNDGAWHHLALIYKGVESKNANNQTVLTSNWTLYLDGEFVKTLSRATLGPASNVNPRWFVLGGRPHAGDGFIGQYDSWRISSKALEPGEFLCDKGVRPSPTPVVTRAFWPLESADGVAFDSSSRVEPYGYGLLRYTDGAVSGSNDRARDCVPLETTEFSRENVGSVTLAEGENNYLRCICLGQRLALDRAFTVEGWVKWNPAVRGGRKLVAGTYEAASGEKGWRLVIDDTGAEPVFAVTARTGGGCTPLIDARFAKPIPTHKLAGWFHVALSYDPLAGRGRWSLLLDGKDFGTVENLWRNDNLVANADTFYLGDFGDGSISGLGGGYDMWRVSSGLVAKPDLLWQKIPGTVILFR